ncbi:MBOAT family O-acyltransferase [Maribacter halichondriae]|uniref:MBOAT family O-acyltransferase n=1 Tax=Maribacter halichondriae TaxID=2980554 RepID=UPI002358BEF1|nr:MBOAT family O-acyltransferase [Maribacter sp. Hal144]
MLFNSFTYLLFFPLVCILYYVITPKFRWLFLLIASYYFYMNWQPIYALLIFTSTVITYLAAYKLDTVKNLKTRKIFLFASLILNFGILFLFKYYDFFNNSVFEVMDYFGIRMKLPDFDLLLPVGISFYTFQAVGYTIDVYRGQVAHERHFGRYALFVSFFPQLVAGPIERATNLLPQFRKRIAFDYQKAIEGTKLIIWGYFMKIVVADRLAIYVNSIYNNAENHSSTTLVVATIFFAFQIYCDFGGYSNIAIGCAKIMGFDLMTNFRRPYFARSVGEFWQRWHISLSTWFKDYVYIPLGGNKVGKARHYFNLFVTFLVSGLWHGANWTFVIWGGLNGLYLILGRLFRFDSKKIQNTNLRRFQALLKITTVFVLICFSWIFFRANSLGDAILIIKRIFSATGSLFIADIGIFLYSNLAIFMLLLKDLIDETNIRIPLAQHKWFQFLVYASVVTIILTIGVFDGGQFIYFQF